MESAILNILIKASYLQDLSSGQMNVRILIIVQYVHGCLFQHMIAGTDFSHEEARAMLSLAVEYNRILAEQVSPSAESNVAVSHPNPLSEAPAYIRSRDDSGSD